MPAFWQSTSCIPLPCPAKFSTDIQFCPLNISTKYSLQDAIFLLETGGCNANKIRIKKSSKWFLNSLSLRTYLPTFSPNPKYLRKRKHETAASIESRAGTGPCVLWPETDSVDRFGKAIFYTRGETKAQRSEVTSLKRTAS